MCPHPPQAARQRPPHRPGRDPRVRASIRRNSLHILPFFKDFNPKEVTVRHLRRWRSTLHSAPKGRTKRKPAGIQRIEATARAIFKYADRGQIIDRDPYLDLPPVRVPRGPGQESGRVFTEQEVEGLLEGADVHWREGCPRWRLQGRVWAIRNTDP